MSRRRTFYIKAFNIYENTYNRNVYGIWAGGGAFIFGIWAGAGIYEKLAKTTKSVGYEPAMVNMAKLMKKWFFCKKLMFLNCLNGYLFVAFRLQYFAQVFTIDWMRIPPNIKFIHSPNLKLWINVLHANFLKNFRKLPNFNINFEYEAGIFIKKVKILKYSASDFLLNCTKMTSLQSTVGAQQNF